MTTTHLIHVEIDDAGRPAPSAEIEQERRVALFDLLEGNDFDLPGRDDGPWRLTLAIRDRRLVFDLTTADGSPATQFHLSLGPFRQVVKDYFQICASYYEAVRSSTPGQIETIDMARRGIHDEGARVLAERLEGKAMVDLDTARRLFTLICVLRVGAVA
ncbi:MAG: UPF0262 family protein [Paracoccaceae bacterium]